METWTDLGWLQFLHTIKSSGVLILISTYYTPFYKKYIEFYKIEFFHYKLTTDTKLRQIKALLMK
jgi:hypothetical protein